MYNFTLKIICLLNLKYIATFSKHLLLMSLMIISLLMKYLYFSHRNLVDPFGILRILKLHYEVLRYRYFFPFILFDTWCDSFQFGTYAVFQFRGKISVNFFGFYSPVCFLSSLWRSSRARFHAHWICLLFL